MKLPRSLAEALENGTATDTQLRQMIAIEAEALGMTYDEAIRRAADGSLPTGPLGTDIEFLAEVLAA